MILDAFTSSIHILNDRITQSTPEDYSDETKKDFGCNPRSFGFVFTIISRPSMSTVTSYVIAVHTYFSFANAVIGTEGDATLPRFLAVHRSLMLAIFSSVGTKIFRSFTAITGKLITIFNTP